MANFSTANRSAKSSPGNSFACRWAGWCKFIAVPIPQDFQRDIRELVERDKLARSMAHRQDKHSIGPAVHD